MVLQRNCLLAVEHSKARAFISDGHSEAHDLRRKIARLRQLNEWQVKAQALPGWSGFAIDMAVLGSLL